MPSRGSTANFDDAERTAAIMIRRDPEYWQRLRKDRRSGIAVLLTAVAAVVAAVALTMVAIPGTQWEARASPIYWVILIPVAWWINGLAAYEPWAVRSWKPALATLCVIHAICLTLAILATQNVMLTAAGFALTMAFAAAALATHRGSLVACEGPAR
jgi:hypothetical protein